MIDNDRLYTVIGRRIREIRTTNPKDKLTQADLAAQLNLERTSITNIEAGKQKPAIHVIYRLCAHFGLRIEELLPPIDEVRAPQSEQALAVGNESHEVPRKTASVVRRLRKGNS